jgi:endoglucanase
MKNESKLRTIIIGLYLLLAYGVVGCDSTLSRENGSEAGISDLASMEAGNGTKDGGVPATDQGVTDDSQGDVSAIDLDAETPGTLPFLAGVNLACAEFGGALPGTFGQDYTYPTEEEVDYFTGKGMNVFRLPFKWERLQHQEMDSFDQAELSRLDAFVSYATSKGAYVLLDPHNYARYHGTVIGDGVSVAAFADFWGKLADHFKSSPLVIFGLMNEPHGMSTELWRDDANAAIQAIRDTGAQNLILVPGNSWTGAHSWDGDWYGTPNSEVMLTIVDPGNNYAFEAHQYLDDDSSGTSSTCVSEQVGVDRLKTFTTWLKTNGYKGFLGEFGVADNSTCLTAMDNMLDYIDNNKTEWIGWTYWAAGPWWSDYMFSIEPQNGQDAPQMSILEQHF